MKKLTKEFILNEFQNFNAKTIKTSKGLMMACPFPHGKGGNDTKPSLSLCLSSNSKVPIGTWYCFGCQKSGTWNKLASELGFKKFKEKRTPEEEDETYRLKEQLDNLEESEEKMVNSYLGETYRQPDFLQEWEEGKSWRGLPYEFLKTIPAFLHYDDRTGQKRILFAMYNGKKVCGHVSLITVKPKSDEILKSINSESLPVKKIFFPSQLLKKKHKTVVIVEGPFDALRLWYEGIPALAILGTPNWSEEKLTKLMLMNLKRIIICMDGDKPGRKCGKEIYEDIHKHIDTKVLKLPLREKSKRIDPGNMPQKYVKILKKNLL